MAFDRLRDGGGALWRGGLQLPSRRLKAVPRSAGSYLAVGAALAIGVACIFSAGQFHTALAQDQPAAETANAAPNAAPSLRVIEQIDRAFVSVWSSAGVEPAARADDAEFVRRLYLDLAGKIPSAAEARAFLDDTRSDKRERLVDALLAGAIFASHFANTWRDTLLAGTNPELRVAVPEFESWLRLRFAANTPYNQLAAELVAASYVGTSRRATRMATTVPSPIAFYQANERKPELLAASLSSVFLGVQVECAQCHDHPFARWKQDDFWSMAAFFRGIESQGADAMPIALEDSFDRGGLAIPGTKNTAVPRFLDGTSPDWRPEQGNRARLAQWMTGPQNPFFARAAVNRTWEQFFGRPLAAAPDAEATADLGQRELLDALAKEFVAMRYDVKQLIRAIVLSRAYQLSSKLPIAVARVTEATSSSTSAPAPEPNAYFAAMSVRRLTADQLFDSLVQATGFYEAPPARNQQVPFAAETARVDFRNKFAEEGRGRGEGQTSIVQALALMNGKLVSDATSLERSKTLAGVVAAPFLDTPGKLEALFLASLARRPADDELAQFLAYLQGGDLPKRLADVYWVLLNSAEFASNH